MKLIIITDQYPPLDFGGMSQHAYYISEYLSERHDVTVILPKKFGEMKDDKKYKIKSVLTLKYPKYDEYKVLQIAKKYKPDVIHVCTAGMAYKKLIKRYPVVLRVVGNDFMRPWRGKSIILRSILFRIPNKKINNYLVRKELEMRKEDIKYQMTNCTKVVANSDWTRDRLIENSIKKTKIEIIVGGYNDKIFKPAKDKSIVRDKIGIKKESKIIVTAANLVGKKGIDIVIRAVEIIKKEYDIQYYVLGDGEELLNLKKLSKQLGLEDIVHFEGRKNQIELCQFYQAADIYVQISRNQKLQNGEIDVETMGRTYFEAGACGIPVIASRIGGITSIIQHEKNGILVDNVEDVNEVVSVIKMIFNNKALSRRISEESVMISNEIYTWENVVRRFEKLFEDVKDI